MNENKNSLGALLSGNISKTNLTQSSQILSERTLNLKNQINKLDEEIVML